MNAAVPEDYTVAPTQSDHLFKVAVPVPGRDHILISAPKSAWMSLKEQEAVQKWMDPIIEAEQELAAWQAATDAWAAYRAQTAAWHSENDALPAELRTPAPEPPSVEEPGEYPAEAAETAAVNDPERARLITREAKIRFLKPHLSAAQYKLLLESKDIHERTINWILDQATSPEITPGESGASTVS